MHWWRTVFFLVPVISVYTIVLGTRSLASSLFDRSGYFAHWCARTWARLILVTTGVTVQVEGLERVRPGGSYVFVSNHQSHYDTAMRFVVAREHQARRRAALQGGELSDSAADRASDRAALDRGHAARDAEG